MAWRTSKNGSALCNGGATSPSSAATRTPNMVFYAIIGGVPYQDLHYPAPDPTTNVVDWKNYALTAEDWRWIVGNDPEHFDYSGRDPHMIEDFAARQNPTFERSPGTTPPAADTQATAKLGATTATNTPGGGWDPINGREWSTNDPAVPPQIAPLHCQKSNTLCVDRQYACIFKLPTPHDCTNPAEQANGCDCIEGDMLTHAQTPPVCDEATPTTQTYAKAYPTTRELLVARDLGAVAGANPGIVSSICPVDTIDNDAGTDPYFGYRPAMAAILQRLDIQLSQSCIPALQADSSGEVPCLLLAQLANPGPESSCANTPGLSAPNSAILTRFEADNGIDAGSALICQVNQTPVPAGQSCSGNSKDPGWCYVTGSGACSQEIVISDSLRSSALANASIRYQCIETYNPDAG